MKENRKLIDYESAKAGHANGISLQLENLRKKEGTTDISVSEDDLIGIIDEAAEHYGKFLTALGVDWKNDPNSADTPRRVAKAYVKDLWAGRYQAPPSVTVFPTDGYDGMIVESNIPVTSMCSHHHQTIEGTCHIGYIPGEHRTVVGLSKLNRVVEYFARRGAIQEQLTMAIHKAISDMIGNNRGVIVVIDAKHNCVSCRGVKHKGASMQTAKYTGEFDSAAVRSEFYTLVTNAK